MLHKHTISTGIIIIYISLTVTLYAQNARNNHTNTPSINDTGNATKSSSFSLDYYNTHILKMRVSAFYNVPSYWFEEGQWETKDTYTQVFGSDEEIISPYQINTIKKVRYYRYTHTHPLDKNYYKNNEKFLNRFCFYRFTGKTLIPWVDVYLFALDMETQLLFSYALPSRFDTVWSNYVPRDWVALENHPFIQEYFSDTAFYEFDPIGYVNNDGEIVMYDWIVKQNALKEKDPLINYLPHFENYEHEASSNGAGYSPYRQSTLKPNDREKK